MRATSIQNIFVNLLLITFAKMRHTGPDNSNTKKIRDTTKANDAINFHPRDYSSNHLLEANPQYYYPHTPHALLLPKE